MINGKPVVINGKETQYFLFENGDLYNANTHRISQGAKNHGYIRYSLIVDSEEISIFKHRLLAEMFLKNDDPINKTVVHHKDGCIQNNNLNNLEWVSQKENCNKKINPIQKSNFKELSPEEVTKEKWKNFRDTFYEISNMGRIKNTKTNKITFGSINKNNGYVRFTFTNSNGKRDEISAHRAVYETFYPEEKIDVINHIDANRTNNRLENLENISQKENVIKSYYETRTKKTNLTGQYDLNMNLINVYPSTNIAAKALNLKYSSNLNRAIKTGGQSHGFYWRIIDELTYQEFLNKK